jgi:hypothetical protein
LVQWASINEGYSTFTSSQVRHIVGGNRPVFSFWGRTYGQFALYKLPQPKKHVRTRHVRKRRERTRR